jgi:hypothetical protein
MPFQGGRLLAGDILGGKYENGKEKTRKCQTEKITEIMYKKDRVKEMHKRGNEGKKDA